MRKIKLTDVKELYGTNVERVGIEGEYLIII